jgi:hypothetical protein
MHSLVSAVLVRSSWENALMLDPEAHPPDVEIGKPVN